MKTRIAIVLVNYKDYAVKYLEECYKSLTDQTFSDFDIFIADNQGDSSTKTILKKLAPTAKVVINKENLGWAGGNNSIVREYLSEYDYFIFLNMDTYLEPSWLEHLIDYSRSEKIEIAQSKILIYGKNLINSIGNRINYLGYGYCNGYGKDKNYRPQKSKDQIDYVSGASMLVKKEVFEKIGLFREEFFMYHDDLEFCWRAKLAGFNLGLAENSICQHKYSFGSTMNLIYYMERNRLITLFSLPKWPTILLILPILIPFELVMVIYLGLQGKFKEKISSIGFLFSKKGRQLIRKIRREVNTYRTLRDKEVTKKFSGKVEFAEINNWVLEYIANPVLNFYWNVVRLFILW